MFVVGTQTHNYFLILKVQKNKKNRVAVCVCSLRLAFKYQISHYIMFAFLGLKLVHTSKVMTNVASSGVNYWDFSLFFFSPQCSLFCLFHFSSCLVPPLRCSLYWNSNGSRVCVWPARAVIEPICRLAPVGLNPGLTALLRWLNAFAMFLKPILFLPPPLPWQPSQRFSFCE